VLIIILKPFSYPKNLSLGSPLHFQYKKFITVQGSRAAITIYTPKRNSKVGVTASEESRIFRFSCSRKYCGFAIILRPWV